MINQKKYKYFEILIYFVLLFVAFILQSTNIIFEYNTPSPSLILALLIVVSFFEGFWVSSIFGLIAGIMIDTISTNSSGLHALTYMLTGFICSFIIESFLQNNFASFSVMTAPVVIVHIFIELFTTGGFNSGIFVLFFKFHIVSAIYTFAIAFVLYLLFRYVIKRNERFKKPKGIINQKHL